MSHGWVPQAGVWVGRGAPLNGDVRTEGLGKSG